MSKKKLFNVVVIFMLTLLMLIPTNTKEKRNVAYASENKELIQSIKDRGYDSIRIPMTAYRRYSLVDNKYVMDENWLARYKEVVNWALDSGLYVMINIHHDSWIWLSNWNGDKEAEEYKRYIDLWTQLADEFKDFSDRV